MWEKAYNKTPHYLGLDQEFYNDARRTVVCDNQRFLRQRGVDLDDFDVFDLDAYGCPAYQLVTLCKRLKWTKRNKVGIVLTDGTGYNAKMNGISKHMLEYLGIKKHAGARVQMHERETIIRMLIEKSARECNATPILVRKATRESATGGNTMTYASYILVKN